MTEWSNNNPSPAPANGYQRRRQETRRLLLEAACTLFVERGVEQVSIDAITSTAGVAKGSFYNHFESREDLFNELVEETLQQMLSKGLEFTPPVDDRLEAGLARMWFIYYTLLSDPTTCRLLLQAGSPTTRMAIDKVLRTMVADVLMEGIALGTLSHLDPDLVYAAYFGVVTHAIGHLLEQGSALDAAVAADQLTELCFAVMGLPHHTPGHFLDESGDTGS
jgi:AcrR family transcriptional regulator